jgi:hypothetical protein
MSTLTTTNHLYRWGFSLSFPFKQIWSCPGHYFCYALRKKVTLLYKGFYSSIRQKATFFLFVVFVRHFGYYRHNIPKVLCGSLVLNQQINTGIPKISLFWRFPFAFLPLSWVFHGQKQKQNKQTNKQNTNN